MYLFYTPDIAGGLYSLNEEESRHCLKVLRLANGEIIHLTDGRGNLFEAVIVQDKGKQCVVEVQANLLEAGGSQVAVHSKKSFGYRPYRLHIAIAPTKNIERFEWFLEKATEIGIDEITPLICEHSERRQVRTDRLEKVITAAMKQSLKAWHPELHEALDLKHFLAKPQDAEKYIAFITEGAPQLQEVCVKNRDAVLLIGPEGDFSQAEVDLAVTSGYQVVSLGSSRLRTETAGIVACHTIHLKNFS